MKKGTITVFTDGSSRGNPGPGGWGALVIFPTIDGSKVTELGGREEHTTNNRMELMAAQQALSFIETRKIEGRIEMHTDSAYLLQGVVGWMYGWEKNGWKTKTGEDVLNQDIWKEIAALVFRLKLKHEIDWVKVSGHSGLRGNERVDEICTNAADKAQQILFVGALEAYEKFIGGSVFELVDDGIKAKKKKSSSKTGPAYSYVSMIGGLIQTHKTWVECEARVKGKKGAKYQKVFSKEEENNLIEEWAKIGLEKN
jgi:ribonuclease HI